jgi:hypothetical protein
MAPILLAKRTFDGILYSFELFDAVREYKDGLRGFKSIQSQMAKQEADWILWHDPRRIETRCWTRGIQEALSRMAPPRRLGWQNLFRFTSHSYNYNRGKRWISEAAKRLNSVGEEEFTARLDQWLVFPVGEIVALRPPGSKMLCLLVSYSELVPAALPIVSRVENVHWDRSGSAHKVLSALHWVRAQQTKLDCRIR